MPNEALGSTSSTAKLALAGGVRVWELSSILQGQLEASLEYTDLVLSQVKPTDDKKEMVSVSRNPTDQSINQPTDSL